MGRIGLGEIIVIGLVIMLLFGAKKLPELGTALGEFLKRFKKATRDINEDVKNITKDNDPHI
ncbi:MAG: preprotein translocase subunit TatA [Omnitrophica WOR_2 bacterium RIFCSPHIGHO2_01_FULL_48_9]|nr:MAG: preprotein translocase subunit TatA [Omnitrophica WOR_2 bacterium RIFCSPHIGHO2_02_FULL_48_11]OGX30091.1 MAG: preprotein translocase subunit TatA [Omnitrophica WOR_2 bacterium RIFCSPHIGHO2_01_FULL_48_9]